MNERYRNIYQLARNIADLTQLEASERLGISVRDHEENRWNEITKEVREMAGAALSVVFSR